MSGLAEFLHMGGYAFYVWSAYAIVAVVLVANLIAPIRRERAVRRRLARRLRFDRGGS
jgi:heme exporter protein D